MQSQPHLLKPIFSLYFLCALCSSKEPHVVHIWHLSLLQTRCKTQTLFPCSIQFSHSFVSNFCDPMDCSTPGLPGYHQLPEITQLMSIVSVMPSNKFILRCPPLLPPSILLRMRVFYNESVLHIRWPKYWSFSFNISRSNEYWGLISFRVDWLDRESKGLSRVFSNTTVQKHQFFCAQLSLQSNSHIHTWPLEKP